MVEENETSFQYTKMIRRLRSLKEKQHKSSAIAQFFDTHGEDAFEEFLHRLISDTKQGVKRDLSDVLMVIAEFVIGLSEETKSRLADIAYDKNHGETLNFFSMPAQSIPMVGKRTKVLMGKDGKPLSLGERKSFARNPHRHLLTRLLHDPSPDVIKNLLESPKMTEKDVVRIASLRPARPEILEVIFNSRRWIASYRIKVTLVSNPYLPPELGVKIVPSLLRQDLKDLANDNLIHPDVRTAMQQMLSQTKAEAFEPYDIMVNGEFLAQGRKKEKVEKNNENKVNENVQSKKDELKN